MTILFIPAFPMLLTYTLGNKGTICFTFSMLLSFTWEGAFGVLFAPVVLTVQLCTLGSHFQVKGDTEKCLRVNGTSSILQNWHHCL